jgi:hypothetical protein
MRIGQEIRFKNVADTQDNVEGNFSLEKVTLYDDFLGDLLDDLWAVDADTGDSGAIVAACGGVVKLLTDTDDTDRVMLSHEVNWYASKNCVMEARVYLHPITTVGVFIGFTDEKAEAAQTMPFAQTGSTLTDECTNGVGFLFDTNCTTDVWNIVNTNAGDEATVGLAATYDPVADTYQTFRVEVDVLGNAKFYIDGEPVGFVEEAVATTSAFTPNISIQNKNGAAHYVYVDYIKCWQDR